ncbi:MAG: hypothetical protein ACQES9_03385 [Myxococcota bacterium]
MKFLIPILFLVILVLSSCKNDDDPYKIKSSKYLDKNVKCTLKSFAKAKKELDKMINQCKKASKSFQGELMKSNCPTAANDTCIPELGINAIITYISSPFKDAFEKKYKKGKVVNPESATLNESIEELQKLGKKMKIEQNIGEKSAQDPTDIIKPTRLDAEELGIDPDSLSKRSGCGVKVVNNKCKFSKLAPVIAKLSVLSEKAKRTETKIKRFLTHTKDFKDKNESVTSLFKSFKAVEHQLDHLSNLEDSPKKVHKKQLEQFNPDKIKGIFIDLTKAMPLIMASRLGKLKPLLKKQISSFKDRKVEFTSKVKSTITKMSKKRQFRANNCLKHKSCWKFKGCAERYKLPLIDFLKE